MEERRVVVVGAGPAGIAAALALKDVGLAPLVIERADEVASSWRRRYDRLRLNTCRPLSHLPKRSWPKGTPMFPSRDQVVQHIQRHATEEGIELELGTAVERIDRDEDGGWIVRTPAEAVSAAQVIVATGFEGVPFIPEWGRDGFPGELVHSSDYRNPKPFRDRSVLVVGPGSSGMEIAHDVATGGAAKVWLSARTPPNILLREGPGGLPGDMIGVALLRFPTRFADAVARFGRRTGLGDLTEYGLPVPEEGLFSRMYRLGVAPAIVDREVIDAIKEGKIEVVCGVESVDGTRFGLADGSELEPEAVICATGYRTGLEALVGHLNVLDERGVPSADGEQPAAPGLRFIGYVPRPGMLGNNGRQARRAARAIVQELRAAPTRAPVAA
jgi:cation diffusion facilitator CzcD-associated flavoprotein CzcO